MGRPQLVLVTITCLAIALLAALVTPLIGPAKISYRRALAGESPDHEILVYARLPRVALALLAGGGLALAGVLFQALLRDALATPYTLGVSSGAALGAVIAIVVSLPSVWAAAIVGAALTLLLVLAVATDRGQLSSYTLLLTGVSINSICVALILFLQSLASIGQSFTIMRWLMGGIEPMPYSRILALSAALLPLCIVAVLRARDWNLLAVGEEWAHGRGVTVRHVILRGFILGSLLAGSITAFTGPIGFVGLIVPHALRLSIGSDHRVLLPCSFLLGGAFLAVCDTLARTMLAPTEVPVGVITALLGGPFFILLLRSKRRKSWL